MRRKIPGHEGWSVWVRFPSFPSFDNSPIPADGIILSLEHEDGGTKRSFSAVWRPGASWRPLGVRGISKDTVMRLELCVVTMVSGYRRTGELGRAVRRALGDERDLRLALEVMES